LSTRFVVKIMTGSDERIASFNENLTHQDRDCVGLTQKGSIEHEANCMSDGFTGHDSHLCIHILI
jgi:hypothetical protein